MTNANPPRMRRVIDGIIQHRFLVLLAATVLTACAWPVARQLSFDQSIESLYSHDDLHLRNYTESKQLFGGDEFIIVAYTDPDLLSEEGFDRLRKFSDELSAIPGIETASTQNLADALQPRNLSVFARLFIRIHKQELRELFRGLLLGDDDTTTAIVLRLQEERRAAVPRPQTIATVRKMAAAHKPLAWVVGEPVQIHDMFRLVEQDGSVLFWVSLLLLAAVIFFLFRSLRWVLLPLAVVVVAIVWTEALLVLSRMKLSMVSSMLNSLMTIIGIATVTHVTVRFREHRRELDPIEALLTALTELVPAIFWTCATTATGFLALLSSTITPVRSFGIMMGLGSMMVLASSLAILPGGILLGRRGTDPHAAPAEEWLAWLLRRATHWVKTRPVLLSLATLLLVVGAGLGFFHLRVETDFTKNFRESSPIVRALTFVEDRLGGAGTWELNFSAPSELSSDYLDRVRKLAQQLRDASTDASFHGLRKVVCLTDALDLIPVPPLSANPLKERLKKLRDVQPDFEDSLYNAQQQRMRLILRGSERQQAATKRELIEHAEQIARQEFPEAKATGLFVLLTFLIESLLRDQLVSFVLAAIGIGSMMALAFRSLRLGLISLIPNLFPIVLVIGTMGWIGLPINIATAMIASVSMGLTVDSSIHYLTGYRRVRRQGCTVFEAIEQTHASVGRALVFANLALIVGFSVLTLSHFIPLIYFGILVSVAMLGGLLGNLLLLPLLLSWVERNSP